MESYSYVVIDKAGTQKRGTIEAESQEKASATLKKDGYIVVDLTKTSALNKDIVINFQKKPTAREFSIYCRQFEAMLNAGVTVIDALNMLADQTENKTLAKATREIQVDVEKGESLSNAMRARHLFPDLLISMIAAGEASGSLEISLNRMAIQFEKDSKTLALIKKAMVYPIVVIIVAIAVVCIMLVFVIPSYVDMFADMGTELPAITIMVVNMSDFLIAKWWIIVIVCMIISFAFKYFAATDFGKHFIGKLGLTLPLVGELTVKSSAARFARTISTLLAAGIGLVDAVDIVSQIMSNILVKEAMLKCKEQIVQGVPLSQPLMESKMFPPMVYQMVRIGEESGDVEGLLDKTADYYEEEVEMATQSLTAAMEPMIIIVLAVVVGFLVGAVMAPMLKMYEALDSL